MKTQFAHDLHLARRKSGFTHQDLAHLLEVEQSTVSALEKGKLRPSLDQIVDLSLIYGRSFESFFDELLDERKAVLAALFEALPKPKIPLQLSANRRNALRALTRRLDNPRQDAED